MRVPPLLSNPRLPAGRLRDVGLIAAAVLVGVVSGAVVAAMSALTSLLHGALFGLVHGERLSGLGSLASPWLALVPAAGGGVLVLLAAALRRHLTRRPVDPIEANALHGGRMAVGESLLVAVQTMISSGFGASVGLEAGYTQASSALASRLAGRLHLRRAEVRLLVGCAAAGAISAAFDAPLTGAFYGFELILATYTVSQAAPMLASAIVAAFTASWLGAVQSPIEIGPVPALVARDLPPFLAIGVVGGLAAVGVMQLVTLVERLFRRSGCPAWARPLIGGLAVGALALVSPHVLSSGHGALHVDLATEGPWAQLAGLFVLKAAASALSLGSGFRGGLFFASLYLGALAGKAMALMLAAADLVHGLPPVLGAVVGMASLAVGVVGGPLTMTFLVLETTGDLAIALAVLAAAIAASVVVRESFGYSFSTWRLHLSGETIRSAQDVGRIRDLTVGRMMRADVATLPARLTLDEVRRRHPLGATQRLIAIDDQGRYAGMLLLADAYAPEAAGADLLPLLRHRERMLLPSMTADAAAALFAAAGAEELAVVDGPDSRRVIGLLTEPHLLRRYAEELDKARRDLAGED